MRHVTAFLLVHVMANEVKMHSHQLLPADALAWQLVDIDIFAVLAQFQYNVLAGHSITYAAATHHRLPALGGKLFVKEMTAVTFDVACADGPTINLLE